MDLFFFVFFNRLLVRIELVRVIILLFGVFLLISACSQRSLRFPRLDSLVRLLQLIDQHGCYGLL